MKSFSNLFESKFKKIIQNKKVTTFIIFSNPFSSFKLFHLVSFVIFYSFIFMQSTKVEFIAMSTTSLTYSTYRQRFRLIWRRIDFSTICSFKEESIDLRRKVRFNTRFASDLSFIRWKSSYDVTDPIEFWCPTDGPRELFKNYRFLALIYFNIDFWILLN